MTLGSTRGLGTIAIALTLSLALPSQSAWACACCSNEGQRNVETYDIDAYSAGVLRDMAFEGTARLFTGEADVDQGWSASGSPDYRLALTKTDKVWTFGFSQPDTAGTLTFKIPKTVVRFEVDPREPGARTNGTGPVLYKEWRLTTPSAGTGFLAGITGGDQKATLILHGRGNSCTDASQFTAWTLVLHGPKATRSFFGALTTP